MKFLISLAFLFLVFHSSLSFADDNNIDEITFTLNKSTATLPCINVFSSIQEKVTLIDGNTKLLYTTVDNKHHGVISTTPTAYDEDPNSHLYDHILSSPTQTLENLIENFRTKYFTLVYYLITEDSFIPVRVPAFRNPHDTFYGKLLDTAISSTTHYLGAMEVLEDFTPINTWKDNEVIKKIHSIQDPDEMSLYLTSVVQKKSVEEIKNEYGSKFKDLEDNPNIIHNAIVILSKNGEGFYALTSGEIHNFDYFIQEYCNETHDHIKFTTSNAFAITVVTEAGMVFSYGEPISGGDCSTAADKLLRSRVKKIVSTDSAIIALLEDNTVTSWGSKFLGGDSSMFEEELHDIEALYPGTYSCLALRKDKKGFLWGYFSGISKNYLKKIQEKLHNITSITQTEFGAYALTFEDGSFFTFGGKNNEIDEDVSSQVRDVEYIIPILGGFGLKTKNNQAYIWGNIDYSTLNILVSYENVKEIVSNGRAFAIVHLDGTVSVVGDAEFGGNINRFEDALKNVERIEPTSDGFIAYKEDGTKIRWDYDIIEDND